MHSSVWRSLLLELIFAVGSGISAVKGAVIYTIVFWLLLAGCSGVVLWYFGIEKQWNETLNKLLSISLSAVLIVLSFPLYLWLEQSGISAIKSDSTKTATTRFPEVKNVIVKPTKPYFKQEGQKSFLVIPYMNFGPSVANVETGADIIIDDSFSLTQEEMKMNARELLAVNEQKDTYIPIISGDIYNDIITGKRELEYIFKVIFYDSSGHKSFCEEYRGKYDADSRSFNSLGSKIC